MSKIKELRQRRKLTQVELANILGVDHSTVVKWENGTNRPRYKSLFALAKVLKCKPAALLTPMM